MNSILNYFKRFYQCCYKFDLYRDYFKEPKVLAMFFTIPMIALFIFQTYSASIKTPEFVAASFDPIKNGISEITYEEIIDFNDGVERTVKPGDPVNISFENGKIVLEQTMPLEKLIRVEGNKYNAFVDTDNTLGIVFDENNKYDNETLDKMGLNKGILSFYATDTFVIMKVGDTIISNDLSQLTGTYATLDEIAVALNGSYINKNLILQFSAMTAAFLFVMYYFVMYFIVRSYLKRESFTLSTDRKFKIIFYSMQPGLYVYVAVAFVASSSTFALSFITPLASVFTMMFVNTKIMASVKDFVKKEQKAEKRLKSRQQ